MDIISQVRDHNGPLFPNLIPLPFICVFFWFGQSLQILLDKKELNTTKTQYILLHRGGLECQALWFPVGMVGHVVPGSCSLRFLSSRFDDKFVH